MIKWFISIERILLFKILLLTVEDQSILRAGFHLVYIKPKALWTSITIYRSVYTCYQTPMTLVGNL